MPTVAVTGLESKTPDAVGVNVKDTSEVSSVTDATGLIVALNLEVTLPSACEPITGE